MIEGKALASAPTGTWVLQKLIWEVCLDKVAQAFFMQHARKRSSRQVELYSERPISKEQDLLDFIKALDEDEGIRAEADLKNHENGGFIFVGFYRGNYCVNICDKVWSPKVHGYVAGGKDEWYYFDTGKEAYRFVLREAKQPLRAWLY